VLRVVPRYGSAPTVVLWNSSNIILFRWRIRNYGLVEARTRRHSATMCVCRFVARIISAVCRARTEPRPGVRDSMGRAKKSARCRRIVNASVPLSPPLHYLLVPPVRQARELGWWRRVRLVPLSCSYNLPLLVSSLR
jgi:hypothetical protein